MGATPALHWDGLDGAMTVVDRQRRDHARLDDLLVELSTAPPELVDDVLLRIRRLVFPHAFAEEAVLWPMVQRRVPDGDPLTLRVEQEHRRSTTSSPSSS